MWSLDSRTDASHIVPRKRTGAFPGVVFTSAKPDCLSSIIKNRTVVDRNITLLKDLNYSPNQSTPIEGDQPSN